jgi:hypothetical protein
MGRRYCSVEECVAVARRDGLCWGHYKRKQRKAVDLRAPLRSTLGTWDAVVEAMHGYHDAEDDASFATARKRVQRAMQAWADARRARAVCPPAVGG